MNLIALGVLVLVTTVLPGLLWSVQLGCLGGLLCSCMMLWLMRGIASPRLRPDRPRHALLHDKFNEDKVPSNIDVLVIGSGMGGLTAAALLARSGKRVVVLERHQDVCGGSTHAFNLKGHTFDSGLHYTVPWSGPLMQLATLKRAKDVPFFEHMGEAGNEETFDKIYMGDSLEGAASSPPFEMKHKEAHLDRLKEMFPDESKNIDRYLAVSESSLWMVKVIVLLRFLPRWLQPLYWWCIPSSWIAPQKKTAYEVISSLTSNKKLRSLLCSMWIDTGAKPDRSTFMLTAAVFRGLPREGGCYPRYGSSELASSLVPIIEEWGGRVLIRAEVGEITVNQAGEATGVILKDGTVLEAKEVVSACGYVNTFSKLLPAKVVDDLGVPRQPVQSSPGFVMVNVGLKGSAQDLGISNANTWYIPTDSQGDLFPAMEAFYDDPLGSKAGPPVMITFPSVKDTEYAETHPGKTSCQILLCAEWAAFAPWADQPAGSRGEDYEALKKKFADMLLPILYRFYPKTEGKVELVDVSTPLSIFHHLGADKGGAIGLDIPPERYFDPSVTKHLDAVTPVRNLYLTGHDILLPGVVMAQLAGVATAFRMLGLLQSFKLIMQSILLLD